MHLWYNKTKLSEDPMEKEADKVVKVDVKAEKPPVLEVKCTVCDGTGLIDNATLCETCSGSGKVEES